MENHENFMENLDKQQVEFKEALDRLLTVLDDRLEGDEWHRFRFALSVGTTVQCLMR